MVVYQFYSEIMQQKLCNESVVGWHLRKQTTLL